MNSKTAISLVVVVAAAAANILSVGAAEASKPTNALQRIIYNSGGAFVPPANGKSVLLLDLRPGTQAEKEGAWKPFLSHQEAMFKLPMTLRFGEPPKAGYDVYRLLKGYRTPEHPSVMVMVDDDEAPSIATFPEEGLSLCNVRAYKTSDAKKYSHRLTREIWRTFALSMGGYDTMPQGDVLRVVRTPEDLDRIHAPTISPVRADGIVRMARKLQLRTQKPVSYRTACREGWAPAPTNEIQKAIWDKVHALPKNPIKILPETKPVKE